MVSVIVPVYNVARYLPRCIESIIRQTYRDLEIILVDDGSTDKSGLICDRYAKKDARIKVIHKKNEGVSVARNTGIDRSTGEYIVFVDGDDWVKKEYVNVLQKGIEGTELAICALMRIYFPCPRYVDNNRCTEYSFSDQSDIAQFFFDGDLHWPGPDSKLFRSDIIKNNRISFPVGVKAGEDSLFVLEYLYHCKTVRFIDKYLYYYNRLVENSATRKLYRDYVNTVRAVFKKKRRLLDRVANPTEDETWYAVLLQDVYLMIKYYCRFLDRGEELPEIIGGFLDELKEYNIDLTAKKYVVPNYDEDYFRYLSKNDYVGLYEYLRKEMHCDYKTNPLKRAIADFLTQAEKTLLFDFRIGYWG